MVRSSDRGLFITIEGPSGIGKSTTARVLGELIAADGTEVHITAEPSTGPIGVLAREITESVMGAALACLYAADRYHHLAAEILPALASGTTVICDRYILSGLVMQQFDGVAPGFLQQINSRAGRPESPLCSTPTHESLPDGSPLGAHTTGSSGSPAALIWNATSTDKSRRSSPLPDTGCCGWTAPVSPPNKPPGRSRAGSITST